MMTFHRRFVSEAPTCAGVLLLISLRVAFSCLGLSGLVMPSGGFLGRRLL